MKKIKRRELSIVALIMVAVEAVASFATEQFILALFLSVVGILGFYAFLMHYPYGKMKDDLKARMKGEGFYHLTAFDKAESIINTNTFVGQKSDIDFKQDELVWFYDKDKIKAQKKNLQKERSERDVVLHVYLSDEDIDKMTIRHNFLYRDLAIVFHGEELHPLKIKIV